MQIRKSVLFTALALTGVLALSGCAPEAANPEPSATSPVYEIPSVEDVVAGDLVDAEQAAALNDLEAKPGFRAFNMADGTFVVIESAVALPEAVITEIQTQVDALPVATGEEDSEAVEQELGAFVSQMNAETGRNVVVVAKTWTPVGVSAQAPRLERWIHVGDSAQQVFMQPSMYVGTGTADEYLAELFADGVADNATSLELFVQPNE